MIFLSRNRYSQPESAGETVLITGASSGIGKATALYLAGKGCRVVGTSRSMDRLKALQQEASHRGLPIVPLELDINSDEGVESVMPRLIEEMGPIDALVNNAGYSVWGPVESLSIAEIKALYETNFFAAIRMIKAALPGMEQKGRGTIINVSSVLGRLGTPFNGAYVSSKFALEGLSESLRTELWPLGVRVVVVEPGNFKTDFQRNMLRAERAEDRSLPYYPYIERYNARHDRYQAFAADPIKVAKVIYKIIRSRHPAFRYPVGPEARAGMLGARLLPERIFQTLLSRATLR
ncbi:MAG: SDR family oxidoreductase [Chloroflexi bacterium]|nr:SDR family oxidoreductase [Chloroflexota bacterium]